MSFRTLLSILLQNFNELSKNWVLEILFDIKKFKNSRKKNDKQILASTKPCSLEAI